MTVLPLAGEDPSGADGKMYVAHILADEPSLSENKPHLIEEEELAS